MTRKSRLLRQQEQRWTEDEILRYKSFRRWESYRKHPAVRAGRRAGMEKMAETLRKAADILNKNVVSVETEEVGRPHLWIVPRE